MYQVNKISKKFTQKRINKKFNTDIYKTNRY